MALLSVVLLTGPVGAQWDEAVDLAPALGPKRMAKVLRRAKAQRMAMERDQVAVEIREGLLFDPEKVEPAIKQLMDKPKDSWQDNARRICRAFAVVDSRFGAAWSALEKGDYAGAAKAVKPLVSERDTSYLAAARRYCYAEALAGQGKYEDAAEAYTAMVKAMPDRFSFASMALLRAAAMYEKMHRRYYAMSLYKAWVDSFGLLDAKLAEELSKRAERVADEYRDPLGTIAGWMEQVSQRLAQADSGRQTQQKQKDVIEMLDDLIAMAEEQSRGQGQGQGQAQGKSQGKKSEGQGKGKGKGQGKGQSQGQGQGQVRKPGPAAGIGVPSAPATVSRLVGGSSPRPANLSEIRPSEPGEDWGRLPRRQREKLLETFKEGMPERYREMLRDYYRRLAERSR